MPPEFREVDYGNIIADCAEQEMGVFAIRVYAGGAVAGNPPSNHTLNTKFFPLDLYRRDQERAQRIQTLLEPTPITVKEAAVRYSVHHPHVSSAIIGFADPSHVDEAMNYLAAGPLPEEVLETLRGQHDLGADQTS